METGPTNAEKERIMNEMYEVLKHIQFPVLVDILNEKRRRSGMPEKTFSKDIISIDGDSLDSESSVDHISIGIQGLEMTDPQHVRLELFVIIAHELVHYFSIGENRGTETEFGVSLVHNESSRAEVGEGFNEGITELDALEIVREYLRRTGDAHFFVGDESVHKRLRNPTKNSYLLHTGIVTKAVKKIAKSAGISEEAAMEAIEHAYYSNTNISSGEFLSALNDTLGSREASELLFTSADEMEDQQPGQRK